MQVQAITGDRDIMEEFHPDTDINHQVTLIKGTLMDINISVVDIDTLVLNIDTSTAHTEVEAIEDMVIGTGKEAIEAVTIIDENRYRNQSQFAVNGDSGLTAWVGLAFLLLQQSGAALSHNFL